MIWYRDFKFWKGTFLAFWISLASMWLIYEILDHFSVKLPWSLQRSLPFFVLLSLLVAVMRIIGELSGRLALAAQSQRPAHVPSDSILAMMKDAESNSRWGEIIKLGSALSEVLWYTSRKKLRIEVGHFLEVAARQTNNNETLARTLIEDLGNTTMGLGEVNQGITYIKQGIKVAEDNGLPFLASRGYRNLANCYSFKGDTGKARAALAKASVATQSIGSQREQLEANGAIAYAKSKIAFTDGDYEDALAALDETLKIYSDVALQFPETAAANKDRIVKIHREKGVIYLEVGTPEALDQAYVSCQTGLQLAQATQNYETIVRCCCLMAQILLGKEAISAAEGIMNIAANNVSKIDTPAVIDDYNRVNRRLVNARTAATQG
ncbi:tetratricopeptide repeat protein [Micromonospora trifolii]|uniref:tetratricopeptide repeat protein n=1 Tax=Micromonospora trifolii TaxID=2911208 RepID=UPI003CF2AAAA